jgi:hypothetical protein
VAWLWGDVAHVMDLPLPDLLLYAEHAQRLVKVTGRGRG